MTNRFLLCSFTAALLATAGLAQDTSTTPFGGSAGAAFDERAPAERRIQSVTVYSGQFFDGLQLSYERRNGTTQGGSALMASNSGTASVFTIPDGDYLRRVDVWYEAGNGYMRAIRLRTRFGQVQTFGVVLGTQQSFIAPAGEEIVGMLGTGTALVSSLGVTYRPVLASHVFFGTGCASSLGTMQIGYRSGYAHFRVNGYGIVEVTNVPAVGAILAIGFTPIVGGVPLDGFGAPGCSLYQTMDAINLSAIEPDHSSGWGINIPNDVSLVGVELTWQGAAFGAPNAMNLATSNAMRCMIGVL